MCRLPGKVINKTTQKYEYVPSSSVVLTFKGRTLPYRASVFKSSAVIEPYTLTVKICKNCLRHGHIKSHYRSKLRCRCCGETTPHEETPCPNATGPLKCVHCDGPHLPNSKECLEHMFQMEFRSYAVNYGLTFAEAKEIVKPRKSFKNTSNSECPPSHFNFSDHPELGDAPTSSFSTLTSSQLLSALFSEALVSSSNSSWPVFYEKKDERATTQSHSPSSA